jgi:succinyl-diaminopimelate desuccinylase
MAEKSIRLARRGTARRRAESGKGTARDCLRWLRGRREAMVEFLADLVRIPSENPPGHAYVECVVRIERELGALGIPSRRIANDLIVEGSWGGGGRVLYFSGHYDVVPAQGRAQFRPRVQRGALYGRGSCDMKGGLVAMAYAAGALVACCQRPRGRLKLRFVPDEETGGERGSGLLASEGHIDSRALGMLTPEPTAGVVWNASRGALSWRITTMGRAAHVGLHYRGASAFDAMLEVVAELKALGAEVRGRRTSFFTRDDEARHSVLLIGGRVEGGDNFNVVPARCSLTVDRRTNPEESLDAERARLAACVDRARARGARLSVEVIQEGDPSHTDAGTPLARALTAAAGDITGAAPSYELCPGLLETRFYSRTGIPALAYGPGDLDVAHGPRERIDLARMVDVAGIYAATALRLVAPEGEGTAS